MSRCKAAGAHTGHTRCRWICCLRNGGCVRLVRAPPQVWQEGANVRTWQELWHRAVRGRKEHKSAYGRMMWHKCCECALVALQMSGHPRNQMEAPAESLLNPRALHYASYATHVHGTVIATVIAISDAVSCSKRSRHTASRNWQRCTVLLKKKQTYRLQNRQ